MHNVVENDKSLSKKLINQQIKHYKWTIINKK